MNCYRALRAPVFASDASRFAKRRPSTRIRRRSGNPDRCTRNSGRSTPRVVDPQAVEARFPAASAINPLRARGAPAWVDLRRSAVGLEEIEAPFPDVPRHVFHAEGTRSDAETLRPASFPRSHRRSRDRSRRKRCCDRQNSPDRRDLRDCPTDICGHRCRGRHIPIRPRSAGGSASFSRALSHWQNLLASRLLT